MRPPPPPGWPPDELETNDDLEAFAQQLLLSTAEARGLRRLDDPPDKTGEYVIGYADGDTRQGLWLQLAQEWRFTKWKDKCLAVGWAAYQ